MKRTVNVDNNNQLCLMINEREKTIFCVCSQTFLTADLITFSQNKLKNNIGSLVICEDNSIKKIINIKKKKLLGNSLLDKILNFFIGAYSIEVFFQNIDDFPLKKTKIILKRIIFSNQNAYDYFLISNKFEDAQKMILDGLKKSKNYKELIYAFKCLDTKKCLDSL